MNDTTKNYQATFILDTRSCNDVEALIERIANTLKAVENATLNGTTPMGQKNFARIKHKQFPAGIYVSFDVSAKPSFPAALKHRFRLDKTVNRILVTAQ